MPKYWHSSYQRKKSFDIGTLPQARVPASLEAGLKSYQMYACLMITEGVLYWTQQRSIHLCTIHGFTFLCMMMLIWCHESNLVPPLPISCKFYHIIGLANPSRFSVNPGSHFRLVLVKGLSSLGLNSILKGLKED